MLEKSLKSFLEELNGNESAILNYSLGLLKSLRKFFHLESRSQISLALEFCDHLDLLEHTPVLFPVKNSQVQQPINFNAYLAAGNAILNPLLNCHYPKAKEAAICLKSKLIALQYRLESINGGLDPTPLTSPLYEQLINAASAWKQKQPNYYDKVLTIKDICQLQSACQYSEFIKLVLEDETLKIKFLNWALRDKICVGTFIEYPSLQQRINECLLNGRIGHFGNKFLKIKKERLNEEVAKKIVTLPFEGKDHSILDEQSVITFKGNYKLTIAEIFMIFKNKINFTGSLECFRCGITNWNINCHGFWDNDDQEFKMIDLSQGEWWKQLPVVEILTKEEAQARYGWHLDGKTWSVAAVASRESLGLDLLNNHAYLEMVIPIGNGQYTIYDFGKSAVEFPTNPFLRVATVCENFLATVCYPDDNIFYTHRQHACHSFPISPIEGRKFMNSLKIDIVRSRERNFVYQIESENCAEWTQNKLEEILGCSRVPNLFCLPYLETEPEGIMGKIFSFVRAFPKFVQKELLLVLHIPFGAKRGRWIEENGEKIWKSMVTHNFWQTAHVYLPAFLHRQLESNSFAFAVPQQNPSLNGYSEFYENILRTIAHTETKRHVSSVHILSLHHLEEINPIHGQPSNPKAEIIRFPEDENNGVIEEDNLTSDQALFLSLRRKARGRKPSFSYGESLAAA